jgi:guanylate kinase
MKNGKWKIVVMSAGLFFLVAGPAGVGKSTLLRRLVAEEPGIVKAVSVTTRAPRSGEIDGREYYFWDDARFLEAIGKGQFLEHAIVHGKARYGTLAQFVFGELDKGNDVVKDIDVQGVDQIVKLPAFKGRVVSIFVMPPSREELLERLKGRASENDESMAARLRTAENELTRASDFDYVVVNDDLDKAVAELKSIRRAAHAQNQK